MMKKSLLLLFLVSLSGQVVSGQATDTVLQKNVEQLAKEIDLLGLKIYTVKNSTDKMREGRRYDAYSSVRKKLSLLSPVFLSLFLALYGVTRLQKGKLNE
jgi:hypothetical protein